VVIVGVAVLIGERGPDWRGALAYAAGGVPMAVLLGWYHTAAFGGPLEVGYRYSRFSVHQGGIVGVRPPDPGLTLTVLLGERGLFVLTPVALVGLVGLIALLVRRAGPRRDLWVALVVVGAFISIQGGWSNPWAGASPGARYVVPGLPFLAGGLAWAWTRVPVVATATAVAGALAMGVATFTMPLAQPTEPSALLHWLGRAREGRWADTLLTEAIGTDAAILLPLLAAAAVGVVLLRGEARQRRAA
jgi:hypothetical protein